MPDARPELIFVTGPQKGERAVLMDNEVIAGRSQQAGVKITEETVSRQHLRFALTIDGWIVENLSANRVEISGQPYKRGKQVLLETGDTILIGAETTLLFTGPGNDPLETLNNYRKTNTATAQPVEQPAPQPLPVTVTPNIQPAPQKAKQESPKIPLTAAEKVLLDKKRKTKLYIVAGAAYLILMAGLFIFLSLAKKSVNSTDAGGKPQILSRDTITAALTCELNHSPNAEASAKHLRLAREFFRTRNAADRNLYLCVKNYRLYLAFRRPDQKTFQIEDEKQFNAAKKELIDKIASIYDNAWILENGGHWSQSMHEFELLLQRYLPPSELPQFNTAKKETNDAMLAENIQSHISYVSKFIRKKK